MNDITKKRTKLIATIGPSSSTYEKIRAFAENGMTTIRLNFSHGDQAGMLEKINITKKVIKDMGIPISIMLDTKGPEIRIGNMKDGAQQILANSKLVIECDPKHYQEHLGDSDQITVSYAMNKDLKPGDRVVIDDGKLATIVQSIQGSKIIVQTINSHVLKSNKRINLPGIHFSLPFLSNRDKSDILFGIENGVDYIAASFVNSASNVHSLRQILKENNAEHIQIISKIESVLGVQNIEAIVAASDGIMVARGDLGLEIPFEDVPYWQKIIVRLCRENGKPVIVATQMLDSMENTPQPTRAEVTDVYYAVELGSDCTMLSGESASGKFPVESIKVMSKIALRAEKEFYNKIYYTVQLQQIARNLPSTPRLEIAKKLALKLQHGDYCYAIVISKTGELLRTISRFRPNAAIIGLTAIPHAYTAFGIWSSVFMTQNYKDLYHRIRKNPDVAREILKIYNASPGARYIIVDNEKYLEYVY